MRESNQYRVYCTNRLFAVVLCIAFIGMLAAETVHCHDSHHSFSTPSISEIASNSDPVNNFECQFCNHTSTPLFIEDVNHHFFEYYTIQEDLGYNIHIPNVIFFDYSSARAPPIM